MLKNEVPILASSHEHMIEMKFNDTNSAILIHEFLFNKDLAKSTLNGNTLIIKPDNIIELMLHISDISDFITRIMVKQDIYDLIIKKALEHYGLESRVRFGKKSSHTLMLSNVYCNLGSNLDEESPSEVDFYSGLVDCTDYDDCLTFIDMHKLAQEEKIHIEDVIAWNGIDNIRTKYINFPLRDYFIKSLGLYQHDD